MATERIIMGIDPGTNLLGYGLLRTRGKERPEMLAMGVIDLRKVSDIYLKLGRIYERIISVIDEFHPDVLAIEAPFFGKNVQSMLKLGRAQGVVIAAAMSRQIPVQEYAPTEIKRAITGRGAAAKEQVAAMVQHMLALSPDQLLPYLDATDALAAALCHFLRIKAEGLRLKAEKTSGASPLSLRSSALNAKKKSASWADFAAKNADRIHQ